MSAPYEATTSLRMLPDQAGPIRLKAEVRFSDGSGLLVEGLADIPFPARRHSAVILCGVTNMPRPFWSREGERMEAVIATPDTGSRHGIDREGRCVQADFLIKVWDGGAGSVAHPIRLNGCPVQVAGAGRHDFIFSRIPVDPGILVPGDQKVSLVSDTVHHGIEVALPGPALVLRFEA